MVPGLLLPEQPTLARRVFGLAVSVPLHAAAFALLAFAASRRRVAARDRRAADKRHYRDWLWERQLHSPNAIKAQYDDVRLRLLSAIVESTPDGYRAGDAQFLAGEIAFEQGNAEAARQWWDGITPDSADSYVTAYREVLESLRSSRGADAKSIRRALDGVRARWRMFSYQRLRQFGHACDRF